MDLEDGMTGILLDDGGSRSELLLLVCYYDVWAVQLRLRVMTLMERL